MTGHSFRYDLALERYRRAGEQWLELRMQGRDGHEEFDRLRRAFRREEKRDRKNHKRKQTVCGSRIASD